MAKFLVLMENEYKFHGVLLNIYSLTQWLLNDISLVQLIIFFINNFFIDY